MMAMKLISERLLEREIERYKDIPLLMEQNPMSPLMCEKELKVIQKLHVCGVDLTGETKDVGKRLEKQNLYFMEVDEFAGVQEKARRYDLILKVIKSGHT